MRAIIVLVLLYGTSVFADVPKHIQECMDCHGPQGISQHEDMPTIAGASANFIEETFAAYQYDMRKEVKSNYRFGDTSRKPTSMKKLAKTLNDDQISEAADYFSKLPFVAAKQPYDPEKAIMGKEIHMAKCEKCHAGGGRSAADDAPIIAGQWTPYLKSSVKMILGSKRDIDERMNRKVKELTDDAWDNLFNYYASQQ
jgi:sulfide dehydrogenase cytochrome subunit